MSGQPKAAEFLTELHGVKLNDLYTSTDKRDLNRPRRVLALEIRNGVPKARMSGHTKTWVKIDTYKGTVNNYEKLR